VGHNEVPATRLLKVMPEELQRRNFSSETIPSYIGAVERFARYYGKPPDQLGPNHIRQWHESEGVHETEGPRRQWCNFCAISARAAET
jgi:hypothetical protein